MTQLKPPVHHRLRPPTDQRLATPTASASNLMAVIRPCGPRVPVTFSRILAPFPRVPALFSPFLNPIFRTGRGALALLLLPLALQAQAPPGFSAEQAATPEEAQVLEVVDRLFDGMRARDGAMVESVLHPQAQMALAVPEGSDLDTPPVQPARNFAQAVGEGGEPWDEPYFDPVVQIDGNLAHVWTFFHLYRGETFSHCGYNSFQLLRTERGWEITFIAYTQRTENCQIP